MIEKELANAQFETNKDVEFFKMEEVEGLKR